MDKNDFRATGLALSIMSALPDNAASSAAAAAASAAEAKAVQESIPQDYTALSNDVDDLKSAVDYAETFNSEIFNQTGFFNTTKKGYYGTNGTWNDHAGFSCSDIFVLDEVPTYYTPFHSVVTWKNGTCNGQTTYADIANVPAFDRIAFNYTVAQKAVGVDVRYGGEYADPNEIAQNASDIDAVQAEIESIKDVTNGLNDKIGILEDKTYNQTNQLTWIEGSYTDTGSISTVLKDYYHSDYIKVEKDYKIQYTNLRSFGTWCLIAAFNGKKEFMPAKTLFAEDSNFASGTWTVPSGVSYISLSAYDPINATVNRWEATIPDYMWVSELIQTAGSPWKGKSAVIIGDSITAGAYTPTGGSSPDQFADPTFWETAAEMQGLSITGYGISGTSISRTSETLPSYAMSIRYVDMANADLVIVAGGTNDYGTNVALGTIADTTDISFYGALNVLCDGLQTKYPGKRIVFITPIHRANEGANQAGATLEQYRKAIYEVARDVYGFAVIDGRTMGISCKNASFKNVYIYDGLHPTQEGHNVYGQCLGHALNGI